jgi:hypothetical protein
MPHYHVSSSFLLHHSLALHFIPGRDNIELRRRLQFSATDAYRLVLYCGRHRELTATIRIFRASSPLRAALATVARYIRNE